MKNKILLCIVVILSVVCIIQSKTGKKEVKQNINNNINVKDSTTGEITSQDLENYIVGVVAAEMPASFSYEAIKAQAIASRTYAVYQINNSKNEFDVVTDISNQAYITEEEMRDKWKAEYTKYYDIIKKAVSETTGEVLIYDNQVIESFYFAMSNGYTAQSSTVFKEELPYINSVESPWDNESINNYKVLTTLSTADFCEKLNLKKEKINITDILYDDTGRIKSLLINGIQFNGTELRKLLGLRSTDITFTVNKDNIIMETKGYGHGVGMSQYGADGMAKEGNNCYEILKYYYKNVEIKKI